MQSFLRKQQNPPTHSLFHLITIILLIPRPIVLPSCIPSRRLRLSTIRRWRIPTEFRRRRSTQCRRRSTRNPIRTRTSIARMRSRCRRSGEILSWRRSIIRPFVGSRSSIILTPRDPRRAVCRFVGWCFGACVGGERAVRGGCGGGVPGGGAGGGGGAVDGAGAIGVGIYGFATVVGAGGVGGGTTAGVSGVGGGGVGAPHGGAGGGDVGGPGWC